jgi:putative nucleotidyltransferase with HDIG domain
MKAQEETLYCDHCRTEIKDGLYIRKAAGTYCCDKCYFKDTYLDGVVDEIEGTYLATIEAFVSAIDAREHEVGNHSLRVTQFALVIGHRYGKRGRDLVDLYCGALLHDIGKIGIPDAILLKKGSLTAEEHLVMERHPEIGYNIVSHIGYLSKAAEVVRSHHEHFDGTGYPKGLMGAEIPAGARVFAIADTIDALTVKRPYREAVSFREVQDKILEASGSLFDPEAVDAFMKSSEELKDFIGRIML